MTSNEIIELKLKKQISVTRLSELSGVPMGTIEKILSGATNSPGRDSLAALEKVLTDDNVIGDLYPFGLEGENYIPSETLCETALRYGVPKKKQGEYSFEDLCNLPDDRYVELIDGCIYDMSTPSLTHQLIAMEIYNQINDYIRKKGGQCLAFVNAFGVFADCDDKTYVIPDVSVVCDPSKVKQQGIFGAPDLVVEILSPSTAAKDKGHKFFKYTQCGVREYWIIDMVKRAVAAYRLFGDYNHYIGPIAGLLDVSIYGGLLQINLDAINVLIEKYG